MKFFFYIICFCFLILTTSVSYTYAQERPQGTITVSPAYIDMELKELGDTATVNISYKNNSNQAVTLNFEAQDFRHADDFGLIGFVGRDTTNYSFSLASFISLSVNTLDIPANQTKSITVTAKNRNDLSPGGHYAAVIAKIGKEEQQQAVSTKLTPAIATYLLLRKIGGEQFNLSLKEVDWPQNPIEFSYPKSVELLFQNEGNTHVVPYGTAQITDMFGRVIYAGAINESSLKILPSSRRRIEQKFTKQSWSFPVSFNKLIVKGEDSLKQASFINRQVYLFVSPWFIVYVVALGILWFLVVKRRKQFRKKTK